MARGRKPHPCPNVDELRALVAQGLSWTQLMAHFGVSIKAINRWLDEHDIEQPRAVLRDLPAEEWRPVPGWEGQYEVSNMGRVKSLDRIGANGKRIHGRFRRLARENRTKNYWQVHLMRGKKDGKMSRRVVHQLVLEAFVGPRPSKDYDACHLNGNSFDNRLANLRWDTHAANITEQLEYDDLKCPHCGKLL